MIRRPLLPALALLATAALASGCGGSSASGSGGGDKLTLVAYSTPQEVYEEIIPAFQKTPEGKGVKFDQSYAASGEQARAVEGGLAADVVALSLEPDVNKLVKAGLIDENWKDAGADGLVSRSVVVFAVRKGNPKGIRTWDDLVKDGVEVITPNPYTSGGAKWNVMAAYGAKSGEGKDKQAGLDYIKALFEHVPVQNKSAREALQTFTGGKGDVLISYENEAITAQQKGEDIDYVIPDQTLLIENPAAVLKDSGNKAAAEAFLKYVQSEDGQKVFAEKGYRSIIDSLVDEEKYPTPSGLFDIEALGGWSEVNDTFFDADNGEVGKILRDLGVSTG